MRFLSVLLAGTLTAIALAPAALASPPDTADADTKAWWAITEALSSDAMEGRDTGSPGYDRAAQIVAERFKAAGLKPAGDGGGWFQQVAMDEIRIERATLRVGDRPLTFLHDVMVAPKAAMPTQLTADLAYRGYCDAAALGSVSGKIVICHGTRRAGLPGDSDREAAIRAAGGIGMLTIADPGFTVEPPRWPFAYARLVKLAGAAVDPDTFLRFTLNAAALGTVVGKGGQDAADLIAKGSRGDPLPSFDVTDPLDASFELAARRIQSPNVLGYLPGSDPAKAKQVIVLSAHLDGYGHGTSVKGDGLYNGTLDDAAYVALLIRLAEQRKGKGFARPILFAAFAGEEKGLLGGEYFVAHPPVPKEDLAGNINLDQLRPIFPLELLTVHAIDDTSLGADARSVATSLGIEAQRDPEPERNMLKRSEHWVFLKAGIPATGFIFGYRPGSKSEEIYRHWYKTGYHTPQDDPDQPIDWKAASDFNRFFYTLVDRVANKDSAPSWNPASGLKPKP
ncbi:M28 family peptidase [Sphingopyxis panaciterrae]